jgi:DNA-binding response OmpR family regulator
MTRILVIDDDEIVREAIGQVLEEAGYDVAYATDGRRGFGLFKKLRPDLVITDIIMPETEGIETMLEIKRQSPTVPVLVISDGARIVDLDFLESARKLGADDVLAKPFDDDELLARVRHCLKK